MLKADSYSSEAALEKMEQIEVFEPCLCFSWKENGPPIVIEDGGEIVDLEDDLTCNVETGIPKHEVTNQSCLYKLWMCSCWAS